MSMSWIQTAPGAFERKRGFMGHLYHGWASPLGQTDAFGPTTTAKFKHRHGAVDLEAALRQAWLQMLYKFPTLAATSEPDGVRVGAEDGDEWLSNTFLVHQDQTPDQFLARKIKYKTAYIDGRGFAFFWDGFFTALQHPQDSEKPAISTIQSRLPRSMEDMMGVPLESTDLGKAIAVEMLGKMASDAGVPIGMPADASKQPANTRRQTVKLDQDTTRFILDAAKAKGWSVVAAYQTAIILAVQDIQRAAQPDAVGDTYTTESFFDMRRYFSADFDPRHNPIVGCHCVLPCSTKTANKTYDDIVAELTGFFRAGFDNPAIKDIWRETYPELSKIISQAGSSPTLSAGSTPSISNVGLVDGILKQEYGPWVIEDYFFFITIGSPMVPIALWTWGGCLHIRVCFNDGFYTTDEIEELLNKSRDILLENLRR